MEEVPGRGIEKSLKELRAIPGQETAREERPQAYHCKKLNIVSNPVSLKEDTDLLKKCIAQQIPQYQSCDKMSRGPRFLDP